MRYAYKILIAKPQWKRLFGDFGLDWSRDPEVQSPTHHERVGD
jgi:hypothetical protein